MSIYNLPQDIFPGKKIKPEGIIIHDYSAAVGSFKGKSILHTNAISLVISGEKTMHFAEKKIDIKENEFHFLSAGNCLASMTPSPKKQFRSILIFFDNNILTDFYLKYAELIKRIRSEQKIKHQPYVSFKKDKFIYNFIESLDLLLHANCQMSREMKQLKFEELLLHLFHKYPASILSFQSEKKDLRDDLAIKKVVEANIVNNITIEELAFLCNMSLSTFKRRFTGIYGTSPNKWFLQQRMNVAKDLLLHPNEKPGSVYYKVGYENHSSFTESFKQIFGVTPKNFQLQNLDA